MSLENTNNPQYSYDKRSNAVLQIDNGALAQFKAERDRTIQINMLIKQIEALTRRIEKLEERTNV